MTSSASVRLRRERLFLAAVCVLAIVVGCFAGYSAYFSESEAQFHGGVLPEDASEAAWRLVSKTGSAFVIASFLTVVFAGLLPIWLSRLFGR